MTAIFPIVPARVAGRVRMLDWALAGGVVAIALTIGYTAALAMHGLIPAMNAMFDADTGRVLANFTGESENYYRLKVHPWQGWIFIFHQVVARSIGLAPSVSAPLVSVLTAAAAAGLVYVVLRRLALGPWAAAAYALLFCSTAGYVFWSALPEAHMAGGVSVLVAVLLLTGEERSKWRAAAGLAVSFSMVVTNAMVWLLGRIDFEAWRQGWRAFAATVRAGLPARVKEAALGLVLVFAVWAPQWLFLRRRIGIPFNFLEERHYVELGAKTAAVHVLGVLPPDTWIGTLVSVACGGVLIAALGILPRRLWFVPLFPLFGVVLHTIYGSDSAFLFAPNYLPLLVVSLALVAAKTLPKWTPAAVLALAALLLSVNLQSWNGHLQQLRAAGEMKTYAQAVHY